VIRGFPTVEALGLYPTWQTVLAQLVLLALFVFALAKTFWPKRSVSLPTVAPPMPSNDGVLPQLAELRMENDQLRARLAAIEAALGQVGETQEGRAGD
jgi:maltodextrin utilization protein YvdJ